MLVKLKYIGFAFKINTQLTVIWKSIRQLLKVVRLFLFEEAEMFIDYNNINELIEYMICFYIPKISTHITNAVGTAFFIESSSRLR